MILPDADIIMISVAIGHTIGQHIEFAGYSYLVLPQILYCGITKVLLNFIFHLSCSSNEYEYKMVRFVIYITLIINMFLQYSHIYVRGLKPIVAISKYIVHSFQTSSYNTVIEKQRYCFNFNALFFRDILNFI